MKKISVFLLLFVVGAIINAGTIILKDGASLTDVKIISICKGRVVIEKDKVKQTIGLGKIAEYYHTNIKGANDSGDMVKNADYDISFNVKMPKTGYSQKGKKKNTVSECEISYNMTRKGENKSADKAKAPYFYIYILTNSNDQYGRRNIFRFYYPKEAKLKSKGYDKAAILEKINSFERPFVHFGRNYGMNRGGKAHAKLSRNPGSHSFEVPLKGLKNKYILAYHIEVWGPSSMINQKNWKDTGIKSKNWWERY